MGVQLLILLSSLIPLPSFTLPSFILPPATTKGHGERFKLPKWVRAERGRQIFGAFLAEKCLLTVSAILAQLTK